MQARIITDLQEWDTALLRVPNAHVLQSWTWGEIKSRHGWSPTRLLLYEQERLIGAAQVLRRPLPRTPFGVMYVPKGPALDYADASALERVLSTLQDYARRRGAIFIKIDPDLLVTNPNTALLARRGWRTSAEQIQFHNTVLLDLCRDEQEILAGMKPKWRYNIRLAERRGVQVQAGSQADLERFYDLYAETGARDGFLIREFPYYRDVWDAMLRAGQAHMLLARLGEELIAGLILFRFGSRAWYFYGASRGAHREVMPNHLLQWEAMRWAKAQGCTVYDFWGAPDVLEEHAPMFGVYKFKMGFGGEFVERISAHDYVVNPLLYWAYAVARPRYLARLRGQHKTEMGI